MINKEDVIKIINEEINEIKEMKKNEYENETSFETRKNHYLAEAKAIRLKLYNELSKDNPYMKTDEI